MFKIFLAILVVFLSGCNGGNSVSSELKINTSQHLNNQELNTRALILSQDLYSYYIKNRIDNVNLLGYTVRFDLELDEVGDVYPNAQYAFRVIHKKFNECPTELRDGDCDPEDEEYTYQLGFLNDLIYINKKPYKLTAPVEYALVLTNELEECATLLMGEARGEVVDAGEAESYEELQSKLKYQNMCDMGL